MVHLNQPQNLTEPVTRNKIRDMKIIKMWCSGNHTMKDIGSRFGISGQRVYQLIYKNSHLIQSNTNYEKQLRINRLSKLAKTYENLPLSPNRDLLDIHKEMRVELEGDKDKQGASGVTVIMGQITVNNKPLEFDIGEQCAS